jgi:hypothetical protein
VASRDFPVALTVFAHQSSNASAMLIITAVTVQMHLKSDQIDGRLLRTGAANFSASGLKRLDNDLIVIESADAAAWPCIPAGTRIRASMRLRKSKEKPK